MIILYYAIFSCNNFTYKINNKYYPIDHYIIITKKYNSIQIKDILDIILMIKIKVNTYYLNNY